MRRVSKLWDSVVTSHELAEAWSIRHDRLQGDTSSVPWLVMVREHEGMRELVAFDSTSGTWIFFAALLTATCSETVLAALGGPYCPLVVNPDAGQGF
ncbi:hypothetical protein GOP47_0013789, partial [Adiantum capillus-veneris]